MSPPTANHTYHHGDLRNTLILKGLETLSEKGVAGLSLRELARQIGVGHNAPYRHFKNKTELLEAMASVGFRKLKARNVRLELEFANDPETQLFESGMHLLSMAIEEPNLFNLMFGGHLSLNDCGQELHNEAEESMQSLSKIIANGQQQGVFARGELLRKTVGAMSMIQGLAMMFVSSGMMSHMVEDKNQLRKLAIQIYDVLLDGLKKRDSQSKDQE